MTQLPNNFFAVVVPEDVAKLLRDNSSLYFWIGTDGNLWYTFGQFDAMLLQLSGSYEIVSLASEITEEQAGEICESIKCGFPARTVYCDYPGGSDWLDTGEFVETALESFRSLLKYHSLNEATTLIIKQVKYE